jgi:hypothetical protein
VWQYRNIITVWLASSTSSKCMCTFIPKSSSTVVTAQPVIQREIYLQAMHRLLSYGGSGFHPACEIYNPLFCTPRRFNFVHGVQGCSYTTKILDCILGVQTRNLYSCSVYSFRALYPPGWCPSTIASIALPTTLWAEHQSQTPNRPAVVLCAARGDSLVACSRTSIDTDAPANPGTAYRSTQEVMDG